MTVQQMQYLLEVNRVGSISKAAKNLFVSPSSVSCAVSALESELGFEIFKRTWQGVELTKKGVKVLEHASHICEHHRLMLSGEEQSNRMVRIETTPYMACCDAFTRTVESYRDRTDVVFSHRICNDRYTAMDRLARFEVDLLVIALLVVNKEITAREFDKSVKSRRLEWENRKTIPAVVRIGPGHRLYNEPSIALEDLKGDNIVDTPNAMMVSASVLRTAVDIDSERVVLAADRTTRYDLVSKGLGFNIGPLMPRRFNEQYGFRNIPMEAFQYNIISVTNPLRPLRPEAKRYLELLDEDLKHLEM